MGLLVIGPWALFLIYDMLLYIFRSLSYEIPVVGGRAKGRQRPRAPSLTEHPSGHRRGFSFSGAAPALDSVPREGDTARRRLTAAKENELDKTDIDYR